ncbi:MAG: U32 family peptidase, partial [Erysipelotrichales bacterium]
KYNVKVYVTVNTLIFEDEFEALFRYIDQLVDLHVDALILQDVGLAVALRQCYPNLPLHASTQMHLHNVKQVEWAKSLGFSRVVAARETPLEIIRKMTRTGMEIETFVHGALCVSYSGQCLMSSVIGGRSGNRGECAQPCRLPYALAEEKDAKMIDLLSDGEFLLSPKDLCTLKDIAKLQEAGVTSLKVEGRMKRPEYVAQVISSYRKQLDKELSLVQVTEEEKAMAQLFSRGFTNGYLFNALPAEVLNMQTSSHVGLEIGEVVGCNGKYIQLKLKETLHQGDGIRLVKGAFEEGFTVNFLYKEGKLVSSAIGAAQLNQHMKIPQGAKVYRTTDIKQMETLNQQIHRNERRVPLRMTLTFEVGQPAKLVAEVRDIQVAQSSESAVQLAQNAPMGIENLAKVLSKVQDTMFSIDKLNFKLTGEGFMPVAQLNALRRSTLENLELHLAAQFTPYLKADEKDSTNPADSDPRIIVVVRTSEQKSTALTYGATIFSENVALLDDDTGYIPPRATHAAVDYINPKLMLPYFIPNVNESEFFGDFGLNIANARSAAYYLSLGLKSVLVSVELPIHKIIEIAKGMEKKFGSSAGLETLVYGKRELMVMRTCPISVQYKTTPIQCSLCHHRNFYLKDRKNVYYRMEGDATCAMRIYESEALDRIEEIPYLKANGVHNFRIVLDQESMMETEIILRKVLSKTK